MTEVPLTMAKPHPGKIPPILIKGAQVLLPSGNIEGRDVAIFDGLIVDVGTDLTAANVTTDLTRKGGNIRVIKGQGLTLLPGVIDPQMNLSATRPTYEEAIFSATCTGVKGGVTSFLEMPNTPPITTTQPVLTDKLAIAQANSLMNYGFLTDITSIGMPGATDATPERLTKKLADIRTTSPAEDLSPSIDAAQKDAETALPLMLTQTKENRCTIAQVSHWMSTAVAQAYSILNKGLIEPGFDADVVLVDMATYRPVLREDLQPRYRSSPFESWNLTGWPVMTIVGGQVVYDYGQLDTSMRGNALQFG